MLSTLGAVLNEVYLPLSVRSGVTPRLVAQSPVPCSSLRILLTSPSYYPASSVLSRKLHYFEPLGQFEEQKAILGNTFGAWCGLRSS